jgi:hypothetical protein
VSPYSPKGKDAKAAALNAVKDATAALKGHAKDIQQQINKINNN